MNTLPLGPICCVLGIIWGLLVATTGFSRFVPSDADQLDSDVLVGTEYYNDILSYRYPVVWQRRWQKSRVGYQVNTGSVDKKRLLYMDDLRLDPFSKDPVSLYVVQQRRENIDETELRRDVGLVFQGDGQRWILLGDGEMAKEFGDLGVAWSWHEEGRDLLRLTFWSVDHYYNEKVTEAGGKRTRSTYSAIIEGRVPLTSEFEAAFFLEIDHPLRWVRPFKGHTYEYERREANLRVQPKDGEGFYGDLRGVHKEEAFQPDQSPVGQAQATKSMNRQVFEGELGHVLRDEGKVYHLALFGAGRDFQSRGLSPVSREPGDEQLVLDREVLRTEVGAYGSVWQAWEGDESIHWQWGMIVNAVDLTNDGRLLTTEIKTQLSYSFAINQGTHVFVNTTWDIDELWRNFPYNKLPFKPWGGGNIQFQMVL